MLTVPDGLAVSKNCPTGGSNASVDDMSQRFEITAFKNIQQHCRSSFHWRWLIKMAKMCQILSLTFVSVFARQGPLPQNNKVNLPFSFFWRSIPTPSQ